MFGIFGIISLARHGLTTNPEKQEPDQVVTSMTEAELKDIVINRNQYGGKMITAARKELERRGISLTESERQQQEANKQKRIDAAKGNSGRK